MNLDAMNEQDLHRLKAKLELELIKLRSTKKNLDNTIRNITTDMREYRIRHQILIDNPQEGPRA